MNLQNENRYHEDIFGVTLKKNEIQEKAKMTSRLLKS